MSRFDHLLGETKTKRAAGSTADFAKKAELLAERAFPAQRNFVLDQHRRIAALVARECGKTYAGKLRLGRRVLLTRGARCIFVALTRPHAEALMWAALKDLADEYEIPATFNETKLIMRVAKNDAEIKLAGADDKKEIEKQRGLPFDEAGIDEAASHPHHLLANLIDRIIGPRLRGPLWLIGTPYHVLSGDFYDATRPGTEIGRHWKDRDIQEQAEREYSVHTWGKHDNIFVPDLWARALADKKAKGWSDQNPIWRREYLGQWAADDTGYVYKYRKHHPDTGEAWNFWVPGPKSERNPFGLPEGRQWQYVYGMDLGWSDPFALQILAFSDVDRTLYQVYEFSKKGMSVREIADLIQRLIKITGYPDGMVADTAGLGGQVLAELSEVYGIHVEAAEKKNKFDAIELMNSDLIDGRFKLIEGSKLEAEMIHLQFDADGLKENKAQDNHNCDAAVYARRKARHQFAVDPEPPKPLPGTPEALDQWAQENEEETSRQEQERIDEFNHDFFRG